MRIELPSKGADGNPNWIDLRDADEFTAEELFAMHRAVRVKPGAASYSPRELEDDQVNAFLATAITAWSFPAPIPAQNGVVAADVAIGRVMKARDWGVLRRKATPVMEELEGFGAEDPKEPESSSPST